MIKIIIVLSILVINATNTVAQNNYWEKADAKYNSDYRERIRTNMYIKPSTNTTPIINNNNNDNSWADKSHINRQQAAEDRSDLLKRQAADRADALASLPAILEQLRKNKLMEEYLQNSGITPFESAQIVKDYRYYVEELLKKNNSQENIAYYLIDRDKCRERLYIGDYKKLFLEGLATLPYDSLRSIINIMTVNTAPLTAFELLKQLKIKYPNKTSENDNLQIKIYQVSFDHFLESNFLTNTNLKEQMADSYLEFENRDVQVYLKMLLYCADRIGSKTPYKMIIDETKDFNDCKMCSHSEKKEAKKYYNIYYKRQTEMNEKVLEILNNSNPSTKQEQEYLNKIAKGNGNDVIYISPINKSTTGVKKIAQLMQVTPVTVLKQYSGLTRQEASDILYQLANGGDDEAFDLMKIIQEENEHWSIKYKFLKYKKWKEFVATRSNKKTISNEEIFNRKVENGFAKVFYNKNSFYEGEFKNWQRSGKGYIQYDNGNKYEGDFLEDKLNGNGVYTYSNGTIYTGQFKNDVFEGKGKIVYANGDIYEGDFSNYILNGKGIYTYADKSRTEANFINGKANGLGKYIWPSGSYYIGEIKDFLLHGKGKIYYADGTLHFDGEHFNNKRKGAATLYYNDTKETLKCVYNDVGEWEGKLTYTKPTKFKKTGNWYAQKWNDLKYYDAKGNEITESEYNKN